MYQSENDTRLQLVNDTQSGLYQDNSTIELQENSPTKELFGIKLNSNVKPMNLIPIGLIAFVVQMMIGSEILTIYVLTDPDYYNLDEDTLASNYSIQQSYSSAISLTFILLIGAALDKYGRNYLIIVGLIFQAISTFIIPFPKTIYPWYFLSNVLFDLGTIPLMNAPLIPDCVQKQSIGRALSFQKLFEILGSFFGNQILTYLSTKLTYYTIFIMVGSITMLSTIIMHFTLINQKLIVKTQKEKLSFLMIFKKFLIFLYQDPAILLSVIAFLVSDIGANADVYSIFAIQKAAISMENGDKTAGLHYAKGAQVCLGIMSKIICIPVSFIVGYLADRYQVWKIQFINSLIAVIVLVIYVMNLTSLGPLFYFGYIFSSLSVMIAAQLSFAYVLKQSSQEIRSISVSFLFFMMTFADIFIGAGMGWLFDNRSIEWPFYISIFSYGTLTIMTFAAGLLGKYNTYTTMINRQ